MSCSPPPPLDCLLRLSRPCCALPPPSAPDSPLPVACRMVSGYGARPQDLIFSPLRPFLSPLSLLLAFYPSICLTPHRPRPCPPCYRSGLICSRGSVARLQDFHITSPSLPEDLQLFPPLAISTVHRLCFVKLSG